jgi:hypothetical protein
MGIGGLLLALLCAFISGACTLAALSYQHHHETNTGSEEVRIRTTTGIELFASRRRAPTNWAGWFTFAAITFALLALSYAAGMGYWFG